MDRFVLVDWACAHTDKTTIVCYERSGCGIKPIETKRMVGQSFGNVVAAAVELCLKYECLPLVEISGPGQVLLDGILHGLPKKWPPEPKQLRNM